MPWITIGLWLVAAIAVVLALVYGPRLLLGLVIIGDDEVGIVTKKFGFKDLPAGHIVALNGEAGIQADTIPPGWHFGYWPWQYGVQKQKTILIPEGQIALVVANDGATLPEGRTLADTVDCDNFQDARKFLVGGGRRGRQTGVLKPGIYRINTALFDVVTTATASKYKINPESLKVLSIDSSHVGIVTTHDGATLPADEIAAVPLEGHKTFQDVGAFIAGGGFRGLQAEVLKAGTWILNPWFVSVEIVPMIEIPVASVGVVTCRVGPVGKDVSGEDFTNGVIVDRGFRGVWAEPLNPGLHAINIRTHEIEIVPTSNAVLNWAHRSESHELDRNLSSITVRSRDGFSITLDVQQIIHIGYSRAARVIARFKNLSELVDNNLEPIIGNYFRNAVQNSDALDFLRNRSEAQKQAQLFIAEQLRGLDIQGVQTLIGDIVLPDELTVTLRDRKIAEEQTETIRRQRDTAIQQQELAREKAIADQMPARVTAEQRKLIADQNADVARTEAKGEADAAVTRGKGEGDAKKASADGESAARKLLAEAAATEVELVGTAQAKATKQQVDAVGSDNYARITLGQALASSNLKLVPDVSLGGAAAGGDVAGQILNMLAIEHLQNRVKAPTPAPAATAT